MILVEVDRGNATPVYVENLDRDVIVIAQDRYDMPDGHDVLRKGTFFHTDDRNVDSLMQALARANPGCDINVYRLEKVGHCPAGEYVAKQVTKAGTLPF